MSARARPASSPSRLLGHGDYNGGVTESDTLLMLLPKAIVRRDDGRAPFRDFVFHLFAERIADLMQLIEEVAFRKLDQRLAALLLGKGRALHVTTSNSPTSSAACARSSAGCLAGFAEQGFVRLAREQVEIIDAAGLRQLAALGSIRS